MRAFRSAVCHGVLLLARAIDPATGRSPLHGKRTTALIESMELTAWNLTRLWPGDCHRLAAEFAELVGEQARPNRSPRGWASSARWQKPAVVTGF